MKNKKTPDSHVSSALAQQNPAIEFQTLDGKSFEVSVNGSLGLLAVGDLGILAWRQKRQQLKQELAARTEERNGSDFQR